MDEEAGEYPSKSLQAEQGTQATPCRHPSLGRDGQVREAIGERSALERYDRSVLDRRRGVGFKLINV